VEGRAGPMLEAYLKFPRSIRLFNEITWGERAERYGDRANDKIHWLEDLPAHLWSAAYLYKEIES
jgi:hypothetical protein